MSEFDYQTSQVYLRDKFVPFREANLSVASSSVLYGLSVYTVLGANWDEQGEQLYVFRLRDHWQRLVNSARIMGMADFSTSHPYAEFEQIIMELLKINKIREDSLIRATIFIDELIAGTRIDGLKNSFCAYVYPMGQILPKAGIHCCISSWTRIADNMIPARAKINGSYVNASLMKNEALLNGYDDAIALDVLGHVTEGTVANLFVVRNGELYTPETATDILEGITRDSVCQLAKHLDFNCTSRAIDRSELYIADEVFMVGSSARIIPVLSIDRRLINTGKIGPIANRLLIAYQAAQIKQLPEFEHWTQAV